MFVQKCAGHVGVAIADSSWEWKTNNQGSWGVSKMRVKMVENPEILVQNKNRSSFRINAEIVDMF